MAISFSAEDLAALEAHGIEEREARRQLALMTDPPSLRRMVRAAVDGDGIERIASRESAALAAIAQRAEGVSVSKFVPASGAATRMFAALARALGDHRSGTVDLVESDDAARFFTNLDRFAFAPSLGECHECRGNEAAGFLERMLYEPHGFLGKPKGLIPFHRYGDAVRSPFEEHVHEGLHYCRGEVQRFHFTVAAEFRDRFEALARRVAEALRTSAGAAIDISFSEQHRSTDTLALADDGSPFREDDGSLLFRPGGHGSLLKNLEETSGDVVVIKNIDNVVTQTRLGDIVFWKRVLIGRVLQVREKTAAVLRLIDEGLIEEAIAQGRQLISGEPGLRIEEWTPEGIRLALDRPIRVCGMVRNDGEPGGGPFWVGSTESPRLQIVESSEVDMSEPSQRHIWSSATHFNPVDIVCSLTNYRGEPFRLARFADENAVFVSRKTHAGRPLLALERPGLWNGGMAHWITLFVEVPSSTFAPVKTVFDLLRKEHQSSGT